MGVRGKSPLAPCKAVLHSQAGVAASIVANFCSESCRIPDNYEHKTISNTGNGFRPTSFPKNLVVPCSD